MIGPLDHHENYFEEDLFRWSYIEDCKYDMCLELEFHCDQDLTTRAYLNRIQGTQCSFRGFFWHKPTSTIAVTSKECPMNELSELEVILNHCRMRDKRSMFLSAVFKNPAGPQ